MNLKEISIDSSTCVGVGGGNQAYFIITTKYIRK